MSCTPIRDYMYAEEPATREAIPERSAAGLPEDFLGFPCYARTTKCRTGGLGQPLGTLGIAWIDAKMFTCKHLEEP